MFVIGMECQAVDDTVAFQQFIRRADVRIIVNADKPSLAAPGEELIDHQQIAGARLWLHRHWTGNLQLREFAPHAIGRRRIRRSDHARVAPGGQSFDAVRHVVAGLRRGADEAQRRIIFEEVKVGIGVCLEQAQVDSSGPSKSTEKS